MAAPPHWATFSANTRVVDNHMCIAQRCFHCLGKCIHPRLVRHIKLLGIHLHIGRLHYQFLGFFQTFFIVITQSNFTAKFGKHQRVRTPHT